MFAFVILFLFFIPEVKAQSSQPLKGTWYICKEIDLDKNDTIALKKTDTTLYHICRQNRCENTRFRFMEDGSRVIFDVYYFGCADDAMAMSTFDYYEYLLDTGSNYLALFKMVHFLDMEVKYQYRITPLPDSEMVLNRIREPVSVPRGALVNYIRGLECLSTLMDTVCQCRKLTSLFGLYDSVFKQAGVEELIRYSYDTSYVIKYNAYTELLYKNEVQGLHFLKREIGDSTLLDICYRKEVVRYNQMLVKDYLEFLKTKYYYGGMGRYGKVERRVYSFGHRNRRTYRHRKKELKEFLKEHHPSLVYLVK